MEMAIPSAISLSAACAALGQGLFAWFVVEMATGVSVFTGRQPDELPGQLPRIRRCF